MPEGNLFFFTGENTYALSEEVTRWKRAFVAKHGDMNLTVLSAASLKLTDLLDSVASLPFVSERRLVLCEGVPRLKPEDVESVLEAMHPATILAIVDAKPDKRLSIVKALLKSATVKLLKPLSPSDLSRWIEQRATARGTKIDADALRSLVHIVGTDQWMLATEVDKLCAFAERTITREMIDLLTLPSGEQVIWRLTDLIGGRRIPEALAFVRERLERGEDAYGIWVILLNMIKNVAAIWVAMRSGLKQDGEIAAFAGVHFLGVRSLRPLAQSLDEASIRSLVSWALGSDMALKTGGYRFAAERPGEIVALAERAIIACGGEM